MAVASGRIEHALPQDCCFHSILQVGGSQPRSVPRRACWPGPRTAAISNRLGRPGLQDSPPTSTRKCISSWLSEPHFSKLTLRAFSEQTATLAHPKQATKSICVYPTVLWGIRREVSQHTWFRLTPSLHFSFAYMETACGGCGVWDLPAHLIPFPGGALGAEWPCGRCPGPPISLVMTAGFLGPSFSEPASFPEASHGHLGLKFMASP